jgi:hypothetical protein
MPSNEQQPLETGTTSALDRMALTGRLTQDLLPFLQEHGFKIEEFGQHQILRDHSWLLARLKKLDSKKSQAVLMVKFSPDYLCVHESKPKRLFFLDAKASITPVFFSSQIELIRTTSKLKELRREDIGEVEREAWDVYSRFFSASDVAICFASPYHPRLLVAEWVSRITPLYRLEADRNLEAGGSGTPHVNIHLGRMRTVSEFLREEFRVSVDEDGLRVITDFIKTWPLNKPRGRVNWKQFNNVVRDLKHTCPWLEYRGPNAGGMPLFTRK